MQIGLSLCGLAAAWLLWNYGRLLKAREHTRESWIGIEGHLKRRHELVPALVECVRSHQSHEGRLLEAVMRERRSAVEATGVGESGEAERSLGRDLGRIAILVKRYPQLRGDPEFCDLMARMVGVEDQIRFSQLCYNASVRFLNSLIDSFPANLIANLFFFLKEESFEVETASDQLPPVVVEALRARFLHLERETLAA